LGGSGISWNIYKKICTSLQTDNRTKTSSLDFYTLDALHNSVKAQKALYLVTVLKMAAVYKLYSVILAGLCQCFDAVGWAAGRAYGL